jgi:ABC-type enterochelin transport system ATPase subunit
MYIYRYMNDLVAIMELRKAKSVAVSSLSDGQQTRCCLNCCFAAHTQYVVLTYNIFMECLHLISNHQRCLSSYILGHVVQSK